MFRSVEWERERTQLLGRRISELGLSAHGTRVERLAARLYAELAERNLAFRPPVYLSDQWGCPDGAPLIGVPFYLADERLERIEAEHAGSIESDDEAMRYLRHEAGHALNYAFRLHERESFGVLFGDYARPYREHYAADPLSREYVRHILGWYAQKHPDEDFAETFAVWLTPGLDWRTDYAGWPALAKLEWVDELMRDVAALTPAVPELSDDDLPVEAMHWTVAEHYADDEPIAVGDARQFDGDLRRIFAFTDDAPSGERAELYLERHEGELVSRVSYWAGVAPAAARALMGALQRRASALHLRVAGLEAATLIELTAFGTALLNLLGLRYTGSSPSALLMAGDKRLTKKVLSFHKILTPEFATLYRGALDHAGDLKFPLIVKPPQEDASLGITSKSVVRDVRELLGTMDSLQREFQSPVLVEEFVEGREFYVGVLGNASPVALPVIELDFSAFPPDRPKVASWEAKWGEGGTGGAGESGAEFAGTTSVFPTDVPTELAERMQKVAIEAFNALRLRDYGRVDLRVTAAEEIYVIEVNPNCYLEQTGEFARAAEEAGIAHDALVARILELAQGRYTR